MSHTDNKSDYNPEFFSKCIKIISGGIYAQFSKITGIGKTTIWKVLHNQALFTLSHDKKLMIDRLRKVGVLNAEVFFQPGSTEDPQIVILNNLNTMEVKPMDMKTLEYFKLIRDPFISPEIVRPDDQWVNSENQNIIDVVLSTATMKRFIAIIGAVGTGKSNLYEKANYELRKIQGLKVCRVLALVTPYMEDKALLTKVISTITDGRVSIGIDKRAEELILSLESLMETQTRFVLMIDEAHKLPVSGFQGLKLLVEAFPIASVVLFCQPRLFEALSRPELKEIEQRLERYYLYSFSHKLEGSRGVASYIQHKLRVVGVEREVFTAEAIGRIGEVADTVLDVNNICKLSMIEAAKAREEAVSLEIVNYLLKKK